MCGLNGLVTFSEPVDQDSLVASRDRIAHRGPDDAGVWISPDGRVGLAHRRLSIIDLSQAGHQPLLGQDQRHVIVYNGELYNFESLRDELRQKGFSFFGDSDTEVILAAYRAWGESCLDRFNGMYAFAIYDPGDTRMAPCLFLARDHAGEKPLYYSWDGHRFKFASELKAMNGSSGLDLDSLNRYLAFGFVDGSHCLAAGVSKIPPGHAARLDITNRTFSVWRYWALPAGHPPSDADPTELVDKAETLLVESVRLRLRSDVPVGILLSGGIDSSLVAAAAVRASGRQIETFTAAVPGSSLDESEYAQSVARSLDTRHHVLPLEQPSLDAIDSLAGFVDEPIADSSILPSFLLCRKIRQHVTVALGGDGGDELFGGYAHYAKTVEDLRRWSSIPRGAWRPVCALAGSLPAGIPGRRRVASLRDGPLFQNIWGTNYFDPILRRRLLTPDAQSALTAPIDTPEQEQCNRLLVNGNGAIDRLTRFDFESILPDDYLVKIDRASMANSLELRSPYLDPRLIEFAFTQIPDHWKLGGGERRRVQRQLVRRWLPPNFDVNRKQGFSVPIEEWFRADGCAALRERISDLPSAIHRKAVGDLIQGQLRGRNNGSRLFALTMLAIAARNNHWR